MAVVGINHTLEFDYNPFFGIGIRKRSIELIPGKDEIPESTWEFSYEKNEDGTWDLYLDLKNYEDFKTRQFFAVGDARLVIQFGFGSPRGCCVEPDVEPLPAVKKKSSVKYLYADDGFNLRHTALEYLRNARIWSLKNVILRGSMDSYDLLEAKIILFSYSSKPPVPKMQSDFSDLLENGSYTDLILVSEGKKFKVHKSILCARSRVFKAMLEADMKEKNESKVDISHVKSSVLEKMLMFIYTGTLEGCELLEELYKMADMYEITDLKEKVDKKLCWYITVENVDKRLNLADQFNLVDLKQMCLEFMKAVEARRGRKGWQRLFC